MPVINPALMKIILALLGLSVAFSPIPSQYQQDKSTNIIAVDEGAEDSCWYPEHGIFFIDKNGKEIKFYQEDGFAWPNEPWDSWVDFEKSLTKDEEKVMDNFANKFDDIQSLQKELKRSSIKSKIQKSWFS